MAQITICDRCKGEIEFQKSRWGVEFNVINTEGHSVKLIGRDYCVGCSVTIRSAVEKILNEKV